MQSTSLTIITTPYGKNHDKIFMRGFCITFENSSFRYVNSPISRCVLNAYGEIQHTAFGGIPNSKCRLRRNSKFQIQHPRFRRGACGKFQNHWRPASKYHFIGIVHALLQIDFGLPALFGEAQTSISFLGDPSGLSGSYSMLPRKLTFCIANTYFKVNKYLIF